MQRKKHILAYVLMVIFALHYANISFFYHSHKIDGFTVSHSHFHDTEHAKAGTHSKSELLLIALPSNLQTLPATLCVTGIGLFFLLFAIIPVAPEQKPISVISVHSYLRGPPARF